MLTPNILATDSLVFVTRERKKQKRERLTFHCRDLEKMKSEGKMESWSHVRLHFLSSSRERMFQTSN